MNDMTVEPRRGELVAIPPKTGGEVQAFIPRTPEEIKWTAGMIIGSGLAPDSFNNDPKKIAVAIMKGLEIGMPPFSAVANIAVINGRATIWGDGAIALAQASGTLAGFEEREIGPRPSEGEETHGFPDDYGFEIVMKRKGVAGDFVGRFTVGDAKRAKLWMNPKRAPWMLYPRRMLRMRAIGFAIRNGFADCLAGMMVREEVEDLPPVIENTSTSFLDDDPPPASSPAGAEPAPEAVSPADGAREAGGEESSPSPPAGTPEPPAAAAAPWATYHADPDEEGNPVSYPTRDADHFIGTLEAMLKECKPGDADAKAIWRRNADAAKALSKAHPEYQDRVNACWARSQGKG